MARNICLAVASRVPICANRFIFTVHFHGRFSSLQLDSPWLRSLFIRSRFVLRIFHSAFHLLYLRDDYLTRSPSAPEDYFHCHLLSTLNGVLRADAAKHFAQPSHEQYPLTFGPHSPLIYQRNCRQSLLAVKDGGGYLVVSLLQLHFSFCQHELLIFKATGTFVREMLIFRSFIISSVRAVDSDVCFFCCFAMFVPFSISDHSFSLSTGQTVGA